MAGALPRFKLKPGMTLAETLRQVDRKANRTGGFSGADCWVWQGNARIGWRHASCVGTYMYNGTPLRFKATWTPISCTKERVVMVIPSKTETSVVPWKHEVFICGH